MGDGSLIGFVDNAKPCNATQHQRQGGERHHDWKKGARLPEHRAERTRILIHFCLSSGKLYKSPRRRRLRRVRTTARAPSAMNTHALVIHAGYNSLGGAKDAVRKKNGFKY